VLKTFQYRLYPTKAQETKMRATLDECRWLYNHFLEARKTAWEERGESLRLYDQHATLPALKADRPSLATVHSQVLQNVGVRIDLAFKAFFRRVKASEEPGYPRFRGRDRYDSFCYPQAPSGCKLVGDRLTLSSIGTVKVRLHRPLEGRPKTVCIRRSSTGKWYVTFSCAWEPTPLPESRERVGIDVGLHAFAAFSTGDEPIENPRFFRQEEKALATAQRRLAKEAKGTPKRRKRRKVVARVHERTRWKRQDFAHQHSRRLVNRFQMIAAEDLSVNRMVHNHCLAKSISDAAWAAFAAMLSFKAEWAGRTFVAVNPAYTSQDCSRCGHRQKMPLSDRTYRCPCCELELDRDHNAALNILSLGLQSTGFALGSPRL
jgi:putative transposase